MIQSNIIKKTLILQDIQNDLQYNAITREIDTMYSSKLPFWMVIETQQVHNINPKYLYKFGKYLNSLKSNPPLLQYSQIHVYDDFIFNLLYTLFVFISRPIAKVAVIYYDGGYNSNISLTERSIKKIKEYFPCTK